jgi:AraC family transcriptional regulator, transcriptional activator of pobA
MARGNRSAAAPIPQFALYGETVISHKPEFAHLEDIRERSLRNGWVIKPHRHTHLFQILCIFSGAADVRLDEKSSRHNGSCIITIPPGVVHGFRFRPDTRGVVLSLAIGMSALAADDWLDGILDYTLGQPRAIGVARSSPLLEDLSLYLELLRKELATTAENQHTALLSLIRLVLITIGRHLQQQSLNSIESGHGIRLASRFRALLEQHYREHWKICGYAAAMAVSVSTLNRACHEALGSTAKKLIQERLHIEAKRRLIYTQETFEQISADLGFRNAAYFSRAFKRIEGVAPKNYRKSAGPWKNQ